MDKVFMLIILLIVGFWGYLKYSEDSGNWIATGNNGVIGEYSNYDDCVADVKSKFDVNTEVFSCNRD